MSTSPTRAVGRLIAGVLAAAAATGALPMSASAAPATDPAPLHVAAADAVQGSYLVVYADGTTPAGRERVESRVKIRGNNLAHRYTAALRGFAAKLSPSVLDEVRRDPAVAYVEADALVPLATPAGSWGQDRINQRNLPLNGDYASTANGSPVHAYIVDSGIRTTHTQFGGRATLDANFVGDGRSDDCLGHGTHVAGTVGGATVGVARGVRLHAVRVFGCGTLAPLSTIISGIDWVTANAQRPAVMNLSLGASTSPTLDTSTNAAINAGITTVVAAGNSGADACDFSPARVTRALTVANSTSTDARYSGFGPSNFGTCVDLFAPGTDIVSASNTSDTGTFLNTGTSMASPHVAGVAAMYLQRHRNATPVQVHDFVVRMATVGVVTDVRGSPNRLLYSTFEPDSDYNGDGASDIAVWRPSNGHWFVLNGATVHWGQAGDIPVPGDYNGDGTTDFAVWRPFDATWYVLGVGNFHWGQLGDIPVPADYNGDGTTDVAIWRPSTGVWWILGQGTHQWGVSGDVPVPADYNGDGLAEIAVWRPSNGTWFVAGFWNLAWGVSGDRPVQADYSSDGLAEVAVWRPSDGNWFVRGFWTLQWGVSSDVPVIGDYNGDGLADVTVWRPGNGWWFVRGFTTVQWGGSGDIPV